MDVGGGAPAEVDPTEGTLDGAVCGRVTPGGSVVGREPGSDSVHAEPTAAHRTDATIARRARRLRGCRGWFADTGGWRQGSWALLPCCSVLSEPRGVVRLGGVPALGRGGRRGPTCSTARSCEHLAFILMSSILSCGQIGRSVRRGLGVCSVRSVSPDVTHVGASPAPGTQLRSRDAFNDAATRRTW